MKVLVTGITGKSGRSFFQELCDHSSMLDNYHFDFVVRDINKANFIGNAPFKCSVVKCDLSDRSQVSQILNEGGYNQILNIAGISKSPILIEEGINSGIEWFIMVHTTGIYSKYKSASASYKAREEHIMSVLSKTSCKITILRPTMIYGTLDDRNVSVFIKMVDRLRLFPVVSGAKFLLQPVWYKDLGRAYFQCMMNKDNILETDYVLSGAEPIMLLDMFKEIANQLNVKNFYFSIPFPLAYIGACFIYLLSFHKVDYREKVQRLVEPRAYNHDNATRDFGYNPVKFKEGVKQEILEYKNK